MLLSPLLLRGLALLSPQFFPLTFSNANEALHLYLFRDRQTTASAGDFLMWTDLTLGPVEQKLNWFQAQIHAVLSVTLSTFTMEVSLLEGKQNLVVIFQFASISSWTPSCPSPLDWETYWSLIQSSNTRCISTEPYSLVICFNNILWVWSGK